MKVISHRFKVTLSNSIRPWRPLIRLAYDLPSNIEFHSSRFRAPVQDAVSLLVKRFVVGIIGTCHDCNDSLDADTTRRPLLSANLNIVKICLQ
eukprot:3782711-Pleurochrysis_carterae.AAC.2